MTAVLSWLLNPYVCPRCGRHFWFRFRLRWHLAEPEPEDSP